MDDRMRDELFELLRIPSVSVGTETNPEGVRQAADWVADKLRRAGGDVEIVQEVGNPLVVGELAASAADAPTVLVYGHYDVQSIGDPDAWETDPFEPVVRDGRIWARGASDDKGNFWPLLWVACEMAQAGELPVNVRAVVEGEEEAGSAEVIRWIGADERGADCAIVFDSGSIDPSVPAITVGVRGVIGMRVTVTVAERDLHSGIFGGSVLNANHELMRCLEAVLPGPDGMLRDELRRDVDPVPEVERASWDRLPPGDVVLELSGGRPLTPGSGDRYFEQNGYEPSLDVTELRAGEPRTIVPAKATAFVSMRLAPGQSADEMSGELERLIRQAAHPSATVEVSAVEGCDAAAFDADSPPLRIARDAFEAACGTEPLLFRLGGSIPVLAPFAQRGIQTILSGFAALDDNIHAPNESYRLASLELGVRTARELYTRLADLPC